MLILLAPPVIGWSHACVEVRAGRLRDGELREPVGAVRRDASDERREREPVEAQPAPRDQRDARDEEQEVQDELDHALRPLRERLRRLEVEPPDQVDEEEGEEERERDDGRARQVAVEPLEPVDRANATRNNAVTTSEKRQRPATSHWSFANVTVKTVAKKSPSTTGRALRDGARTVEGDRRHDGES